MKIENHEIRTQIESIIRKTLDLPAEKEIPDNNLFIAIDVDSLLALEVLVSIEQEYDIQIPDEYLNVELLSSLTNLIKHVSKLVNK
jgi:acyl carrier protein